MLYKLNSWIQNRRHSFDKIKAEVLWWLGAGVFLLAFGFWLNDIAIDFFKSINSPFLDSFTSLLTERVFYLVVGFVFVFTAYRVWTSPEHNSRFVPALLSLFLAVMLGYVLKSFFGIERPFNGQEGLLDRVNVDHLLPLSYSFPSNHTAAAFALLIPFYRVHKGVGVFWGGCALLIAVSRVYQNVHYVSDIAAGIFIGGVVGAVFSHPEVTRYIRYKWENSLEFRRQLFHFWAGFLCVFAHWGGFLSLKFIAVSLLLGLLMSIVVKNIKLPLISPLIHLFDRPRDKSFPGRGAFYYFLGVFLTFLLGSHYGAGDMMMAYASILILAVGDTFNRITDKGKKPEWLHQSFPWNKKKNLKGLFVGILLGSFAAQFFVGWISALTASIVVLIIETCPLRIGKYYLDDNLFVPLLSFAILWWMQNGFMLPVW